MGITKIVTHLNDEHGKQDVTLGFKNIMCCYQCDKSFSDVKELNSHLIKEHEMNSDFNCPEPECQEWFVSSVVLTAHRLESHNYNPIKDRKPEKAEAPFEPRRPLDENGREIWPHHEDPRFNLDGTLKKNFAKVSVRVKTARR